MSLFGRLALIAVLLCACLSLLACSASAASTIQPSRQMLSGGGKPRNTNFSKLKVGSGRVLYLRFHVKSSWEGYNLLLSIDPSADSQGLYLKKVRASWKKDGEAHGVSSYKSVSALSGPALITSIGSIIDLSSQLSAGKTYTLKIWSRGGTVRSSLPVLTRSSPTPVAAVGDIACPASSSQWNNGQGTATRCGQAAVASLVQPGDQKVLLLGDNQYPTGALSDYQAGFAPSWAGLASRLRPVPGNHEYYTPGAQGYFDYFASLGVPTGGSDKGYYAYDSGDWRIIALNSNDECTIVSCSAGSAQEVWLRSELAAARAAGKCTLAYWHHPRASGGGHGDQSSVSALWKAVYELGGDVVLGGHDHNYQRFGPLDGDANPSSDGPRQWVVGTGGYSFYNAAERPGSAKTISDTFGLLRLNLSASSYAWQWAGVGGSGSDTGSAACRA